jgi:hypothetical protein
VPDFQVLGIASIVCILLWIWKEDYKKRNEILEDRAMKAEDHADRAVRLMEDLVAFCGDVVRKFQS